MINTSGPYGSVTYNTDPNAPGGYSQVTTLSPDQQRILNLGSQAQIGALGTANDQIGRVASALSQGLQSPTLQTSFNQGGPIRQTFDSGPTLQESFNPGGEVQSGYDSGGRIYTGYNSGGPIQSSFDHGGPLQYGFNSGQQVQGHVGPQDLYGAYQSAADASYGQAQSRLDPQWDLQQKQLQTQLANQGLSQDSDAYKNAMDQFQRQKTDAYNQANFSAQNQGLNAENTIFGQSVQQGQFANSAAAQQYAQNQGQAAFNNQTAAQAYQQNLGAAQFSNQAQAQANAQNLAQATFGNSAQAQQNAQNYQAWQAANAAQAQRYGENQGLAQFYNQTAGQQFGQNQAQATFGNTAAAQQYAQNQGAAQFGNQAMGQQFQQDAYSQQLPINEFDALMSSGQVGMPQGINYTPSQVNPTDVLGAYALNTQAQQAAYNAQMQNQSSNMGGLFRLGASLLTAPMTGGGSLIGNLMPSDQRLKTDIRRVGTLDNGVPVYSYRYKAGGPPQIGVMAHELATVRPDLVAANDQGFLAVNYGGL